MKRMVPVIVLAIVLASNSAWAADATAALDLNSAYVWRGITFNDGLVAQPSLDVSKNGFGLNVWGNYDIDEYEGALAVDDNDFSEIDLTAYYGFSMDRLEFSVGIINYLFPSSGAEGTVELYGGVGLSIFGGLSAGVTLYYDVDEVEDYYADLGLTYAMALSDALSLEAGANMGFASEDFAKYYSSAATDGGLYNYNLSLSLGYAVSEALSISATINYTGSMDDDVLPDADTTAGVYGSDTEVYGGISIACTF